MIEPKSCTPAELRSYTEAMLDMIEPGQPIPQGQLLKLLSMALGVNGVEASQQQPTAEQRLSGNSQGSNPFNRQRRLPPGVIHTNKPKSPLKQHHFSDPTEMQRLAEYDMKWQASQAGLPDGGNVQELNKLK